jgi:4,5-DOPA dioxygenase extradiol
MRRRTAIKLLLGAGAAALGGTAMQRTRHSSMPVIFLAHGSPQLLDDAGWMEELRAWADGLPRPTAVLMLSAHWEARPPALGASTTVPLVYDFFGFPQRYYETTYPAPGAPALATRVRELLTADGSPVATTDRGLDHGAYVPLVAMYPAADVPVLQLSLPSLAAPELFALGRTLAPLRDEGVLIVGSGFLTHNLRMLDPTPQAVTPAWAAEFDAWAADVLVRRDVDALLDYRARAPGVALALPTHEHFAPVVAALGAAVHRPGPVTFPITGFVGGSLTRRSVQLG